MVSGSVHDELAWRRKELTFSFPQQMKPSKVMKIVLRSEMKKQTSWKKEKGRGMWN